MFLLLFMHFVPFVLEVPKRVIIYMQLLSSSTKVTNRLSLGFSSSKKQRFTFRRPWICSPMSVTSLYRFSSRSFLSVRLSRVSFFSSFLVKRGSLLHVDMSFCTSSTLFLACWTRDSRSITSSRVLWMYSQIPAGN